MSSITILSDWKGKEDFSKLKDQLTKNFNSGEEMRFIFIISSKKMLPELPVLAQVIYTHSKDFSFFGTLKNQELKRALILEPNNVLLCSDTSANKYVKKLIKLARNRIKIGFENESLPNFDLAFRMENPSREKLFEQTEKYLKKIQL